MINYFKNIVKKIKLTIIKIARRKHFLDFFIAMLTIPVLLTVLITNILTLQSKNKATTQTNEKQVIIQNVTSKNPLPTEKVEKAVTTPTQSCKKEIGPIKITSPKENETITDNPVCITIQYDNENYCSVVWSYRINEGSWSEYSSNSVCLYNAPKGNIKFDLRVQSTVSNEQTTLSRNFAYEVKSSSSSATTN